MPKVAHCVKPCSFFFDQVVGVRDAAIAAADGIDAAIDAIGIDEGIRKAVRAMIGECPTDPSRAGADCGHTADFDPKTGLPSRIRSFKAEVEETIDKLAFPALDSVEFDIDFTNLAKPKMKLTLSLRDKNTNQLNDETIRLGGDDRRLRRAEGCPQQVCNLPYIGCSTADFITEVIRLLAPKAQGVEAFGDALKTAFDAVMEPMQQAWDTAVAAIPECFLNDHCKKRYGDDTKKKYCTPFTFKCSDTDFVGAIIGAVVDFAEDVAEEIMDFAEDVGAAVVSAAEDVADAAVETWNAAVDLANDIGDGIEAALDDFAKWAGGIFSAVGVAISRAFDDAWKCVGDFFNRAFDDCTWGVIIGRHRGHRSASTMSCNRR